MLTSTLQVARNVSVRVPVFRASISEGNEAPQTGWAPSSIYIRKTGVAPYAKALTVGVNFFEVDATNMKGLYEVALDASDVDTLGYVTVTDGAASSITFEVVESPNTGLASAESALAGDIQTVLSDSGDTRLSLAQSVGDVQALHHVVTGRWQIDDTSKTLKVFDTDGVTPIMTLALSDSAGAATSSSPTQTTSSDPALFALSAVTGTRWPSSRTLTIYGKNLPSGSTVTFGSTTGIVPSSATSTSLVFTYPSSELSTSGAKLVRVVPPSGPQPNDLSFTVIEVPPSLCTLSATTGERWFASTSMSISGYNLRPGATVNFGSSTNLATTYTAGSGSVGTLSFTVPESEFYETGTRTVTLVYGVVTASTMTFSVTQPSSLIQDLRADRGITLNGSNVSAWSSSDVSGDSNRVASQATASLQPTYRTSDSDFNNQASVKFVRSSGTKLVTGNFNTGTWAQTTIAAVLKSVGSTSGAWYIADDLLSSKRTYVADYNNYFSLYGLAVYRGGPTETMSLGGVRVNTPSAMFLQIEGAIGTATTERVYVRSASNGNSVVKGNNTGQTGVTLGDRYAPYVVSGGGSFDGSVAEWLMFNAPLTQDQRTRLGNYFVNRYGSGVMTP